MEKIKFKTGEDYYNRIHFIFNAIIAVSLLPFSLVFLNVQKEGSQSAYFNSLFAHTVNFAVVILIFFFVYKSFNELKKFRKNLNISNSFRKKLNNYYEVFLKHNIVLGVSGLIITLALFLTKSNLLIVVYIILLVLLSIHRPTLKNIIQQLKLSKEEQNILYNKLDID